MNSLHEIKSLIEDKKERQGAKGTRSYFSESQKAYPTGELLL